MATSLVAMKPPVFGWSIYFKKIFEAERAGNTIKNQDKT